MENDELRELRTTLHDILDAVNDTAVKVARIDERTKTHTGRLDKINGSITEHDIKITAVETKTETQEKGIDDLKKQARNQGGGAGLAGGGLVVVLAEAGRRLLGM